MFYPKNVPNVERALRIIIGIGLLAFALVDITQGNVSVPFVAVVVGSALFVIVTGFIGWCPACAMIGRKIKTNQHD